MECVFSVEKRVFGDENYGRSDRMRNKESKLRNICYNIYKASASVCLILGGGFLQSYNLILSLIPRIGLEEIQ